jgi:hypothetical protein
MRLEKKINKIYYAFSFQRFVNEINAHGFGQKIKIFIISYI